MATPVGKMVLEVLKKDCKHPTCCYRAGNSDKAQDSFAERVNQKLKFRVADGNDVRVLEERVAELEKLVKNVCLPSAVQRKNQAEQDAIKKVLERKKK